MNRYTLFVTLINESGTEVCRGIYASDEWDLIKDDEYTLTQELEKGMSCLVLENIGDGTQERGTFGSTFIPKQVLDKCVVKMEIVDIEE